MAFGASRRVLSYQFRGCFWGRLASGRYHDSLLYSPSFSSALSYLFSTLHEPSNPFDDGALADGSQNQRSIDERFVISELSDLLLVQPHGSVSNTLKENPTEKQMPIRAVDGFLLPEEKLRGVFLQKLNGKTAIEHALANTDVNLSQDVVDKALITGSLGSEAMVTFFYWAIKQPSIPKDTSSYNIILKALGRRRFFDSMMDVLHNMTREGVDANMETVSIVVDSLVKAHQVSKALQLFRNLKEIGLKCDTETLNILLQCMCRRSHVGAANSFFNLIKGNVPFDATTYNIIIGGWSRYGRHSEVERILKAMEVDGFSPDCLTYTYLLECLGRANRIDDAVKIFDKMDENGCSPDVDAYNAMISNFICIGDFDKCLTYYRRMLSNRCEPDINTYSNLIIGFLKAKKVADALEMFDEMVGRIIPTTGAITSFMKLSCSYGPPHAAMLIYKKARKVGCRISKSAYKLLLMRLSLFGKFGMLLNIWNEMQESGYDPDVETYEHAIDCLCKTGQLENAVLVMEECLRQGFFPSRQIRSKLNNKLLASDRTDMAYKLWLKVKVARHQENLQRCWRAKGWHY
ncbi:putative pentatricopeptide repeat-containing protein At5g43820 [Benincasa hispida]|uniref:putative pentatricopeptide repeat-containing protein At5g43820 n=1 Tax=Benincasa hispida TaxID=102211 RepID=UPI0019026D3D|nr:putative pentatricopeptide repeat-containing protein At5g43820 [Benincasa hispida]XP_038899538.1 putative pentatricopeptide repeat-containing protein At5g43820 [Benincasa hispida]XP_038899539.1 putative pentatricopeptide repeat-containing protein At5g43820 [Benincasa hispida]XP_038899540.1 putative pentatricopeptide repeat-containing protein At5g43820 [Benincasa hispida]XP_038899541.1 putative pentatricopeptide repeat-containing protein At5g43820 [Benincasa hispida]XP_038899542.1 putative p